jgi:SAM-dependent methyltransferase
LRLVSEHREILQSEFERVARVFDKRTRGRFDHLGVVEFVRLREGESVAEIGAGTGNFLSLFSNRAARLIAVDLTAGMLSEARKRIHGAELVVADGAQLPLRTGSIDVVTSAQALHHILRPVPFLKEMRRVASPDGRILIVDHVAPESYEQATMMNELERVRDPSHAASRPPSAFRIMARASGLEIIDERMVSKRSRLSEWMWPGEFPPERIDAVRRFIDHHGDATGMEFERDVDDYTFTRRRIMMLARRAGTF